MPTEKERDYTHNLFVAINENDVSRIKELLDDEKPNLNNSEFLTFTWPHEGTGENPLCYAMHQKKTPTLIKTIVSSRRYAIVPLHLDTAILHYAHEPELLIAFLVKIQEQALRDNIRYDFSAGYAKIVSLAVKQKYAALLNQLFTNAQDNYAIFLKAFEDPLADTLKYMLLQNLQSADPESFDPIRIAKMLNKFHLFVLALAHFSPVETAFQEEVNLLSKHKEDVMSVLLETKFELSVLENIYDNKKNLLHRTLSSWKSLFGQYMKNATSKLFSSEPLTNSLEVLRKRIEEYKKGTSKLAHPATTPVSIPAVPIIVENTSHVTPPVGSPPTEVAAATSTPIPAKGM